MSDGVLAMSEGTNMSSREPGAMPDGWIEMCKEVFHIRDLQNKLDPHEEEEGRVRGTLHGGLVEDAQSIKLHELLLRQRGGDMEVIMETISAKPKVRQRPSSSGHHVRCAHVRRRPATRPSP